MAVPRRARGCRPRRSGDGENSTSRSPSGPCSLICHQRPARATSYEGSRKGPSSQTFGPVDGKRPMTLRPPASAVRALGPVRLAPEWLHRLARTASKLSSEVPRVPLESVCVGGRRGSLLSKWLSSGGLLAELLGDPRPAVATRHLRRFLNCLGWWRVRAARKAPIARRGRGVRSVVPPCGRCWRACNMNATRGSAEGPSECDQVALVSEAGGVALLELASGRDLVARSAARGCSVRSVGGPVWGYRLGLPTWRFSSLLGSRRVRAARGRPT